MLNSEQSTRKKNADDAVPVEASASRLRDRSGDFFDERHESLQTQELLEMTVVSLVVQIAKFNGFEAGGTNRGTSKIFLLRHTIVEHMCAVDVARPIAVREGILNIIVDRMRSKD